MTVTASTPFADLDDYIALPRMSGLAVSADGSRVVTTVSELNDKRTPQHAKIWYQVVTAFLSRNVLGEQIELPEALG